MTFRLLFSKVSLIGLKNFRIANYKAIRLLVAIREHCNLVRVLANSRLEIQKYLNVLVKVMSKKILPRQLVETENSNRIRKKVSALEV